MKITDSYSQLPVAAIAGEVNASLEKVARLVVTAPPGAGKSTLLPLSILEVRKELRRRYPKHPWPDNPLTFVREPR